MTVCGQEIDGSPSDVDDMRTEPLDRIDEQRNLSSAAEFPEPIEVVAKARGEFDMADRQNPGRVVDCRGKVVDPDPSVVARDQPEGNTSACQVHPRIDVRRVLLRGGHHAVAFSPGKPFGDEADAVSRAGYEGDLVLTGADQSRRVMPQHAELLFPA